MTEAEWNAATIVERVTWLRKECDYVYIADLTPMGINDWTYAQALAFILKDARRQVMHLTELTDTMQEDYDAVLRKTYLAKRRKGLLGWLGFRTYTG